MQRYRARYYWIREIELDLCHCTIMHVRMFANFNAKGIVSDLAKHLIHTPGRFVPPFM